MGWKDASRLSLVRKKTKEGSGDSGLGDDGTKRESMLTASHLTRAPVLTDQRALEIFWEFVAADNLGDIHGDGTRVTTWRDVIPDCRFD